MPNFEDATDGTASIIHTANGNFEITENPYTPPPTLEEAFRRHAAALPPINTEPYQCSPPPRRPRRRQGLSDPDAAIRKDPNAWSLREAVELCKLLEVVLPEAGFHIALTGPLLYLDGKRKECHLMFYQIRGTEPNYEVLWKYLQVAGVIRSPSYPENGWLVKATYRGKAIDCLFPNAKKVKKVKKAGASNPDCYKAAPPAPSTPPNPNLVRHNDGAPIIYRRSPSAPVPYDAAMRDAADRVASAMAEVRSAEDERASRGFSEERVPGDFENPAAIPEPPF